MNTNSFLILGSIAIAVLMVFALFSNPQGGNAGIENEWEPMERITTSPQRNSMNSPQGNLVNSIGNNDQNNPSPPVDTGNSGLDQYLYTPLFPIAATQKIPIEPGVNPPILIKELGIEVVEIAGGYVKITGVMGKSWAEKAGLKNKDIITSFNKEKITGLDNFKTLLSKVTPESDYPIKILRGDRIKSLMVMVGEGEMEGFTPIIPIAFNPPPPANLPSVNYSCPNCGISYLYRCPNCNAWLVPAK